MHPSWIPLTLPQRDIYFEQALFGHAPSFNIGARIYVEGPLDLVALNEAYNQVIAESDALRMVLVTKQDEPGLEVLPTYRHTPEIKDVKAEANPTEAAEAYIMERFRKPFDLASGTPPHQFVVVVTGPQSYVVLSMYHHLIVDGWGASLIYKRWTQAYREWQNHGHAVPSEKTFSYEAFSAENQAYLQSEELTEDRKFWKEQFEALPEPLSGEYQSLNGGDSDESLSRSFAISRDQYNQLVAESTTEKGSAFHLFIGAIARYFGGVFNQPEVVLGLPILNRSGFAAKRTVGLYTGITPLRVRPQGDKSMADLMTEIKQQLRASYRHQKLPLGKILQDVNGETGNRELLHDIFFSYEKHDYSFQFEGCECLVKTVANPYNRTTITVYVREYTEHEDVWVDVVCNLEKMPRTLAESVAHQFEDYVKALVGEMLTPLSQIPLVPEPAQQQVHSALQGPELASTSLDFLTQFEEQVATKAKQVAIQVGTSSLTFGELNTRANQIAHWLRHQKAVQPGDVVAMYLARTDWLLPILLGIMKAGAAWLPIDRKSPTARVTTILADSGAVLLLCEDEHLTALQDLPGIISRSAMVGELDSEGDHNPVPSLTATSLAYMIYTSGTTGTPKGVEISHGALNNFLQSMAISPGLHSDDRWLASTSYAFDISILEMLLPLQVGATLVIADEVQAADPIALSELFEEAEPTVMQGTPSLWAMLIEAGWKGSKHLKLLSGGEKLPASLAAGLQTRCAELWNMFGPTETTIWSALESIQGDDVAIGKPIHNTEFYVLGHEGDLLPEGAIGELYIGGAGVARGYHNHPELTAQKFVPDTQFPGQRMYQTGDLGYQLQGRLHFIRRMDTQVKIRGHRIETAEVEAVLLQHESISQATVLVHSPQEGESFLTAYVVGNPPLTTEGISSFLAEFLPPYMIPAFIDVLDEMPLTISGKVDGHALRRRALPQVSSTSESAEETYDSLTRKVRSLWVEVLGNPHIGLQDSFFLLGGDSLKAVRILSRINRELSIQVALKTLFDAPRLADFCQQLREARQATYTEIPVAPDQETYPLSPAQHRIWLLSQREQGSLAYTMKEAFQLRGSLDESALSQEVAALLAKHPVLRTQFVLEDGQPRQHIGEDVSVEACLDIKTVASSEVEAHIASLLQSPFDLAQAPLFKIVLLQTSPQSWVVYVAIHHLIADGWSLNILLDDLLAQYHLARTNRPLPEVSPELHYTDYAVWHLHQLQTDSQAHQDFWLDYLRGGIPDFKFPYRTQDLEPQGLFAGQTLEFTIPKALSQKLRARAASQQITLQSALLGVYSHLLHQVTEQDRLAIGIATAGREHPQLENMIGVFVNFLPLISELTPDNDPVDHIRQLASQVATLNEHGTYPVEQLLDQLHFGDPQQTQLYDTALIYHTEQSYRVLKEKLQPELRVSTLPYAKQHATLPFKLDVFETRQEGPLHGALEYATNRLTADLAKQLVQAFVHLLEIWTEVETGALPVRQEMTSLAPSLLGKGVGNSQDPVQVIASFTADSLVPYLQAYASIAQLDLQVRVAPYHQVVQTIHRGQNHAFQILAVRFEDYLLNHQGSIAEKQALLRDILAQLQEAVLGVAPTKGQWIVALFPVADADFPAELQTVLAEVYQQWQAFAEKHLQLVDLRALPRLYALAEVHDSLRLDMAHIPYTEEFFAVAGVGMVRKMTAYRAKPLKVIAVDCDNTLWDGVCGEVGHQGIRFTEANLTLQRFLIQKQREGFLIVLASKNSEADVWAVFDQRADMLLTRDMITDWRINWLPKSENLLNLAQELSLGISSFVFIDDNPVECLEVLAHVLDVLTLPFPKTESALAVEQMLFQIWGLDKWKVTQEDQQRTQLYQEERSRKQVQQAVASETDFLARLQLRVSIHEATHEEVERVSQLTYRTNQFNVSQKRRSVEEIMHLPQEHKGTWVVEAEDQYGHYGIIGVVIAEPQGDTLVFDTFLMSCRALGRTIEDAVVYHLGQWAQSQGLTRISIPFVPTDRNEPARLFLNRVFQETTTESHTEYQQDIERLKTAEHITVLFQDPLPSVVSTPEPAEKAVPVGFAQLETSIPESTEIATAYTIPDAIWALATEGKQAANYRHFQYLTASALQALAGTQVADNDQTATQTALERLAVLFQGVLGHQDIPSDADFFSLGGHSLGATRLLSQIHKEFGVAISLAHFFQHPTLQAVHDFVVTATAQAYQELDAWEGEAFPLSKAQQRIWMLSQMRGGNQAYLLPALLELAGGYDQERLQQAFTQVIRRHENLRTRLQVVPGEVFPQQVVMPPTEVDFSLDLHSAADGETAQSQVETLLAQPISLTEWPAFRAHLIRQPEGPDWMLFTIHHFLADGWSLRQIAQEVVEVYRKLAQASQWQAQPAPFQYRHFVAWEKALPEQSHYQQSRDYWLQIYGKGLLPQTFLKMPGGSSAAAGRGGMLPVSGLLSLPELTARAKASQVSPFVYLLTGVQLFLGQYLQQPTTTVGTVVAGRDRWEFRDQVGLFVNTVLLHHVQDGHQTFEQHLQQAKANMLAAYAHQSFSYYDLVEELHRQGETQVPELHIMVIFNEFSVDQLILDDGVGVKITPIQESHSRFDLSFNYSQTDANLSLELHYNAAVFSPEEIEDFAKRYLDLMQWLDEKPEELLDGYSSTNMANEEVDLLDSFDF